VCDSVQQSFVKRDATTSPGNPFGSAVEETGLPLVTHAASDDIPVVPDTIPGYFYIASEEFSGHRGWAFREFGLYA
jgi:hypothetical protein